jgi:hypothetical protein
MTYFRVKSEKLLNCRIVELLNCLIAKLVNRHLLYFVVKQAFFAAAGSGAFPSAADWKAHDKKTA